MRHIARGVQITSHHMGNVINFVHGETPLQNKKGWKLEVYFKTNA